MKYDLIITCKRTKEDWSCEKEKKYQITISEDDFNEIYKKYFESSK